MPTGSVIASTVLAFTLAGILYHGNWIGADARKSYEFPTLFKIQMAWAETNVKPRERVLVSNSFTSFLYYFKGAVRADYVDWPKLDNMGQVIDYLKMENIRYAFVDLATAFYNPQVFKEYYLVQRPGILKRTEELPSPFKLLPRDPRIPPIFDLYLIQ